MIRSHFGLEHNPFDPSEAKLLPHQQHVFETLLVHARQGGLCLLMGEPGTGKSVIKQAVIGKDPKRMITPTITRTLHTYSNTLTILCTAFGIEPKGRDPKREKQLIDAAWKLYSERKLLVPIIDDAHLMHVDCLRRLRLLMEEFPATHNLILIAQPDLLQTLKLGVHEDIRSRITYSVTLQPLPPDDITAFIRAELDRIGLPHNTFSDGAVDLITRASDGILRRVRNLSISAMLETARDHAKAVGIDQVNRVLMQPHWRTDQDLYT